MHMGGRPGLSFVHVPRTRPAAREDHTDAAANTCATLVACLPRQIPRQKRGTASRCSRRHPPKKREDEATAPNAVRSRGAPTHDHEVITYLGCGGPAEGKVPSALSHRDRPRRVSQVRKREPRAPRSNGPLSRRMRFSRPSGDSRPLIRGHPIRAPETGRLRGGFMRSPSCLSGDAYEEGPDVHRWSLR